MDWTWEIMRAHFMRALDAAIDRGLTQEQIAAAGGLTEKKQNYISKIKHTPSEYGPAAEIFIRLIAGMGRPVSEFFAELEGRAPHEREPQGASGMPPSSEPRVRDSERVVIVNAIIDALQRGTAVPEQPRRRRARPRRTKR